MNKSELKAFAPFSSEWMGCLHVYFYKAKLSERKREKKDRKLETRNFIL